MQSFARSMACLENQIDKTDDTDKGVMILLSNGLRSSVEPHWSQIPAIPITVASCCCSSSIASKTTIGNLDEVVKAVVVLRLL